MEYGYRSLLFEAQSPFQFVQIVHTVDHGRMLLLDGLVNLAEVVIQIKQNKPISLIMSISLIL